MGYNEGLEAINLSQGTGKSPTLADTREAIRKDEQSHQARGCRKWICDESSKKEKALEVGPTKCYCFGLPITAVGMREKNV